MEELLKGIAYVVFSFSDGSKQTIKTTLNKDILRDYGVVPKENYLYDLEHAEFIKIRLDADRVTVYTTKPVPEGGLFGYASRFI